MSNPAFEAAPTNEVYNLGVVRVPGTGEGVQRSYKAPAKIFADLLDRDIVGGQVAKGFKELAGTPVAIAKDGMVTKAAAAAADGVLVLSTDATDGPRLVNVAISGTINCKEGALAALDEAGKKALADGLGGKYLASHDTIKF